jgi:hypothetical protein
MDDEPDLISVPQLLLLAAYSILLLPFAAVVTAAVGLFTKRGEREEPVGCAACGRSLSVGPLALARMTTSFECPSCRYVVARATR